LFKVPVVRQYFHKGILWRASGCKEVSSFELFVDLLYVGIIAINGDAAAEEPTGFALLKFVSELRTILIDSGGLVLMLALQSPSRSPGRSGTTWL
jgi:hypothetical protein